MRKSLDLCPYKWKIPALRCNVKRYCGNCSGEVKLIVWMWKKPAKLNLVFCVKCFVRDTCLNEQWWSTSFWPAGVSRYTLICCSISNPVTVFLGLHCAAPFFYCTVTTLLENSDLITVPHKMFCIVQLLIARGPVFCRNAEPKLFHSKNASMDTSYKFCPKVHSW